MTPPRGLTLDIGILLGGRFIGKEELGRGNLGARECPISEHALQGKDAWPYMLKNVLAEDEVT